jgi:hypothetical protein
MDKKAMLNPNAVKFFSVLAVAVGLGLSGCDNFDTRLDDAINHEIKMINLETTKICIRNNCTNDRMSAHVGATAGKAKAKYSALKDMGQIFVSSNYKYTCSYHGEQYVTNYRNEISNWAISEHYNNHK